jgi:hypothetical protein
LPYPEKGYLGFFEALGKDAGKPFHSRINQVLKQGAGKAGDLAIKKYQQTGLWLLLKKKG